MRRITIIANYKYEEGYIPPRCRKIRYRETSASARISFPCVSSDEAPVAFQHKDLNLKEGEYMEYRLFRNKLYTREIRKRAFYASEWLSYEEFESAVKNHKAGRCLWNHDEGMLHTEEACKKHLRSYYKDYLFVEMDGEIQVWVRSGEPRYHVCTFGLGHNHASTNYFIDTYYNSNIRKDWYFTALQHNEVVKKALEVAANRGDTDSFEGIKNGPVIEVLIPEAVHCKPNKEAGNGDPFMNEVESVICGTESSMEAGILTMMLAMR